HIAGPRRTALDDRFPSQSLLKQLDQMIDRDGLRLTKIDDLERRRVVSDRGQNALQNVVNVGEIAFRRAVTENRNGASAVDQPREFVNRQVGALARAVDREEPQTDDLHSVKMAVSMRQQLARGLRRGVRRNRRERGVFFERWARPSSVD